MRSVVEAPGPALAPHAQGNNPNNASSHAGNGASSTAGSWFLKFPPFVYDRTAPLENNFYRLAAERKWGRELMRKRWAQCQMEEFGNAYGTDTTKLEAWQSLCREVHIEEPMTSITQCRKVS